MSTARLSVGFSFGLILCGSCGVPIVASYCDSDQACDDGQFCNGQETCDANGDCRLGPRPCSVFDFCDERFNVCSSRVDDDAFEDDQLVVPDGDCFVEHPFFIGNCCFSGVDGCGPGQVVLPDCSACVDEGIVPDDGCEVEYPFQLGNCCFETPDGCGSGRVSLPDCSACVDEIVAGDLFSFLTQSQADALRSMTAAGELQASQAFAICQSAAQASCASRGTCAGGAAQAAQCSCGRPAWELSIQKFEDALLTQLNQIGYTMTSTDRHEVFDFMHRTYDRYNPCWLPGPTVGTASCAWVSFLCSL